MNCSIPIEGDDRPLADYANHPACLLFPQLGKERSGMAAHFQNRIFSGDCLERRPTVAG